MGEIARIHAQAEHNHYAMRKTYLMKWWPDIANAYETKQLSAARTLSVLLVPLAAIVTEETSATELTGEARIRDGDTIIVAGVPVRLNGLHCPELGTESGYAAAQAIEKFTRNKTVSCRLNGEKTYDRWVGRCSVEGYDIGATLIASGVCARCPRFDPSGSYIKAQRQAGRWTGGLPNYCR